MIIVYYPCYNCIDRKLRYMCGYIDNTMSLVSLQLTSSLINRWLRFPDHGHLMSLITGSYHQENDVMDKTHLLSQYYDRSVLLLLLFSCQIHIPSTMRIPEEYLVCYQTSQCNWVLIKMLYRYLQRCFFGLAQIEIRICHFEYRRGISGPSQ